MPTNDTESRSVRGPHDAPRDTGNTSFIVRKRLELGLTQKDVADAVGMNVRFIQKLESGECKVMGLTLENAVKLTKTLKIAIDDLASAYS